MSDQSEATIKLPPNVSVTLKGKTYRGECPDRVLVPEHKLRGAGAGAKKKALTTGAAGKTGEKSA